MPIFKPLTSFTRDFVKSGSGIFAEVESQGSWPEIAFIITAQSATSFVRGPIWSNDEAKATRPYLETLP